MFDSNIVTNVQLTEARKREELKSLIMGAISLLGMPIDRGADTDVTELSVTGRYYKVRVAPGISKKGDKKAGIIRCRLVVIPKPKEKTKIVGEKEVIRQINASVKTFKQTPIVAMPGLSNRTKNALIGGLYGFKSAGSAKEAILGDDLLNRTEKEVKNFHGLGDGGFLELQVVLDQYNVALRKDKVYS